MFFFRAFTKSIGLWVLFTLLGGLLGSGMVFLSLYVEIPYFNGREGFLGTGAINGLLYSIGGFTSIVIVAVIWFFYGLILGGVLGLLPAVLIGSVWEAAGSGDRDADSSDNA